jgi:hypothetical protein
MAVNSFGICPMMCGFFHFFFLFLLIIHIFHKFVTCHITVARKESGHSQAWDKPNEAE